MRQTSWRFDCSRQGQLATLATSTEEDDPVAGSDRHSTAAQVNPLFTCFGYTNETPAQSQGCLLLSDTPDSLGSRPSRRIRISGSRDGYVLRSGFGRREPERGMDFAGALGDGRYPVSSARNAAWPVTMPHDPRLRGTLPSKKGSSTTLHQDLKQPSTSTIPATCYPFPVSQDPAPRGLPEKVDCWPMPEGQNNLDMTVR